MLSKCVYSYVYACFTQHFLYENTQNQDSKCKTLTEGVLKQFIEPEQGAKVENTCSDSDKQSEYSNVIIKPIPLEQGNLSPVGWYYSLFTETELTDALSSYANNSYAFPTKKFLVFEEMQPIRLGVSASNKTLVEFIKVDKDKIDELIQAYFKKNRR